MDLTDRSFSLKKRDKTFESLLENEDFLRVLLDFAPQGIIVVDQKGRIVLVNNTMRTMLGYSTDELTGENVGILVPDAIRSAHKKNVSDFFKSPQSRAMGAGRDLFASKKDGTVVPVEIGLNSLQIESKTYVAATVVDISERKKIEEELRISDERWRFALEGNDDGVWDWNIQTNELYLSVQMKEMLGYEEHELVNRYEEWEKLLHPDDRDTCYEQLERHLKGETPYYTNEHRALKKDGSYIWILDRGKVIMFTEDGKPLRMVGTYTDITRRKQMEQALKESEERFRRLADTTPVPLLVNCNKKIVYANRAAATVLDCETPDGLIKNMPYDAIFPDFESIIIERMQTMKTNPKRYPVHEVQFKTLKKRTIDVSVMASPIVFHGNPAWQIVFNDITEQKRTHKLLEKAALTDSLTGLSNRRDFSEKFSIEKSRFKRNGAPFSIILCDIDHFKKFNDNYGHDCGDYVLKKIAEIMRKSLRIQDVIGRWGGEEFIMLLPETGLKGATVSAEKIRSALESKKLSYGSVSFSVTMSFGVALYEDKMALEDVVNLADNRLYKAKETGRNRVVSEDEQ